MSLEAEEEQLAEEVDARSRGALEGREAAEHAPLGPGETALGARHDPGRRALEEIEPGDEGLYLRDELHGRGARPDDGHAPPVEFVGVVPARRVKIPALEFFEPGEFGRPRLAERAGGQHEHRGREVAARGPYAPELRALVPCGVEHFVSEAYVREEAEVARAAPQVVLYLGLRRIAARPVGVRREGEGVEVRLHVAGAARVGVVAPGPADLGGALEDDEVLLAALPEADGRAEPREAAADDGDARVGGPAAAPYQSLFSVLAHP
jgi:hypothetical protein